MGWDEKGWGGHRKVSRAGAHSSCGHAGSNTLLSGA